MGLDQCAQQLPHWSKWCGVWPCRVPVHQRIDPKQRVLMGLSMWLFFLYGSFLWGIFPIVPRVSWESHFWGAAAGVLMAYFYRHIPAAVQDPKPINWDEDDEDEVNAPPQLEGDNATNDASTQLKAGQWHTTDTWNIRTPTNENPANKDSGGAS